MTSRFREFRPPNRTGSWDSSRKQTKKARRRLGTGPKRCFHAPLPFLPFSATMRLSRPDLRVSAAGVWEFMSDDPLTPENAASVSFQTDNTARGEGSASSENPGGGNGQPAPMPGEGFPRPHRRRRRRRRRGGGGRGPSAGGGFARPEELAVSGPEHPVEGVLFVPSKERAPALLVSSRANY